MTGRPFATGHGVDRMQFDRRTTRRIAALIDHQVFGLYDALGWLYCRAHRRQKEPAVVVRDGVEESSTWRVLGPEDGDILGDPASGLDRFMLEASATGWRFSLVEHRLPPGALAAPLHLHTREDEYSYIIEGAVGAHLGGAEVVAHTGDLLTKPRGQWHTFWNAGDSTARVLEIISPGGLEELFRRLDTSPDLYEPDNLIPLAASYGAEVDFEGTAPIVERHRLKF